MVTVRPATEADSKSIFDWRNDPITVSTSRTQAGVEWNGHSVWFLKQLANPDTTCLIGEYEGQPCGVVWFRKGRSGVFETSVNLAPQFRGRKLSSPMLQASLNWMKGNKGAKVFSTEIQNENLASIKMFERCGFAYVHPSPGFGTYCTGIHA
jgi:RimJ/RimL family protein N-acetyltransferase